MYTSRNHVIWPVDVITDKMAAILDNRRNGDN